MSGAMKSIFRFIESKDYKIYRPQSLFIGMGYGAQKFSTSSAQSTVISNESLQINRTSRKNECEFDHIENQMEWIPGVSRGKSLIEALVNHVSRNPQMINEVSFDSMKSRCERVDHFFKSQSFGAHFLNACLMTDNLTLGKKFYEQEKSPSLSIMANYIRLLARHKGHRKNLEVEILSIYEQILKKNNNMWDLNTGDKVVEAIVLTTKWRDAFKIIEEMKIGGPIPNAIYADLATASFNNKDFENGWSILHTDGKQRVKISPFIAWLRNCQEKNEANMIRLLDYLDENNLYVTGELVEEVTLYFQKELGYNVAETQINHRDVTCGRCKRKLEKNKLTTEEFKELQSSFMSKVIKDQDVFLNTNPKELQSYIEFINNAPPFDFIVDGLNVGLGQQGGKRLVKSSGQVLFSAVKQLTERKHKVLVIGRKHMGSWHEWAHISGLAKTFLIENISNDDPFILYATMRSGIHAKFISRDFMKSHAFRLQDFAFQRLFKRWRLSSQMFPFFGPQGVFRLNPFSDVLPVPQKNDGCWHIPYDKELLISPYAIPDHWLCFKPKI